MWVGCSYSLYLVHWPVKVFASNELGAGTHGLAFAMVVLCLGLSRAVQLGGEPFRNGKTSLPPCVSHRYGGGLAAAFSFAGWCLRPTVPAGFPQK